MSNTTKQGVIINAENKSYHSFNSYARSKRAAGSRSYKAAGVRIVNLDPTDDPDKVCEAYRQIRIADQEKRIKKNKERLAENRRRAAIEAEKEEQAAIRRREVRKEWEKEKGYRKAANKAGNRRALVIKLLLQGKQVSGKIIGANENVVCKDVGHFRSLGYDIVSINAAGSRTRNATGRAVCVWSIDNFERPKKPFNEKYIVRRSEIKKLLKEAILTGLVVSANDFNAAEQAIVTLISELRQEGLPICTVKNNKTDKTARGWILPNESNGLKPAND